MRHFLLLSLVLIAFFSCKEETKKEREAMLPDSSGNLCVLQVVVTNDLWDGEIGETIRGIFAVPIDGLPQEEPLFSIRQMPPNAFDGFSQKSRIFIYIQLQDSTHFRPATNHYAKPQKGYFISAPTPQEVAAVIEKNAEEMLKTLYKTEIAEKQRRMSLSLLDVSSVEEKLKVTFKIPSAYRIAKLTDDFAWLRKDIRTGTTNLMIYEMPLDAFDNQETLVRDLIRMRDSIGEMHIEGPRPGSYMITEDAFAPFVFESEVDGHFAFESKGTWEVKHDFMAGPFVNYIIKDEPNNRILVMEGFTFAPSISKRDYQFELEAIIKSAKIRN